MADQNKKKGKNGGRRSSAKLLVIALMMGILTISANARPIRDAYKGKHYGIGGHSHLIESECTTAQGYYKQVCIDAEDFTSFVCDASLGCPGSGWTALAGGAGGSSRSVVNAYIENVADGELLVPLRHFDVAHTANKIYCQCAGSGTVVASWKNDGNLVDSAAITCDAEEEDGTLTGDPTFAAGSDASLLLGTITGTPSPCYFAMYVTED